MKIAHLIIAHKNPAQLEILLNAMDHPAFDFYIHVDQKTDIKPFSFLFEREKVFAVEPRAKVYWAAYGMIQATINGIKNIQIAKKYDYLNIMSAQDFPIKPVNYIYNFFLQHKGAEFITCESLETQWTEALHRVKKYHFINWRIKGRHRLERIISALLPERKFPLDLEIVGRANWFTLTNEAAAYLIDFIEKHPEVTRFFKYSWGADEIIFSTIIYNSPFKERIRNNLVYVDWTGAKGGHPNILTKKDFPALKNSEKLFARKLDIEVDKDLFTMLEELNGVPPKDHSLRSPTAG